MKRQQRGNPTQAGTSFARIRKAALRWPILLSLVYWVLGSLWIILTDFLVHGPDFLKSDPGRVSMVKGLLYVFVSAVLIFIMGLFLAFRIRRHTRAMESLFVKFGLMLVRLDGQGRILSFSDQFANLLGRNQQALDGVAIQKLIDPADHSVHPFFHQPGGHLPEDGERLQFRLSNCNNLPIWVEATFVADPGDTVEGSRMMLIQEIGDRIHQEQALRENLREKDALINNTRDLVWSLNKSMQLVSYNHAYSQAIHYVFDRPVQKGDPARVPEIGEEAHRRWKTHYERGLAGERFRVVEEKFINGELLLCEITIAPIKDNSEIIGVTCMAHDITKRVEGEKSLRRSEGLLRGIFETAGVGLCIVDGDNLIVNANELFAKLFKCASDDLVGQPFAQHVPAEILNVVSSRTSSQKYRARFGGVEYANIVRILDQSGNRLDVHFSFEIIHFESGDLKVFSFVDLTELQEGRENLELAIEGGIIGLWGYNQSEDRFQLREKNLSRNGLDHLALCKTYKQLEACIEEPDKDLLRRVLMDPSPAGDPDRSFSIELRTKNPAGLIKWILLSGRRIRYKESGSILEFAGAIIDLTEVRIAQREVLQRQEQLEFTQNLARIGSWTLSDNFATWSPVLYDIFECDPNQRPPSAEATSKSIVGEADRKLFRRALEEAVQEGREYDLEVTIQTSSGRIKQLRAVGIPHQQLEDGTWALRGYLQDITQMKLLEQDLRENESRLKGFLNNLPGVAFQYKLMPDGSDAIVYQSDKSRDIWGLTPEEVLEDNQRIWKQIHPDDVPKLMETIKESATNLSEWNCVWRNTKPDGSKHWYEGYGLPERNADGSIVWNSIVIDVSTRMEAQIKLHQQTEIWALVSQHASDGMLACDDKGQLLFFNETLSSWVGKPDPSTKSHEWPEKYGLYTVDGSRLLRPEELSLVRALKGETVRDAEFRISVEGQPDRHVEANGGPLIDENGKLRGAMVLVRDMTDRYEREFAITNAIIESAERERRLIAAELHDAVTQELSIVSMNIKNLQERNAEFRSHEEVHKALQHLGIALGQTRNLSHRLMPETIKDLGLAKAVEEWIGEIQSGCDLRLYLVVPELPRLDHSLEIDIFRYIQEGTHNAIKHSEGTSVTINMSVDTGVLLVSISDDGKGMRPDSKKNTGIGLRTMRTRIERWEGRLIVESDGSGTTLLAEITVNEALLK